MRSCTTFIALVATSSVHDLFANASPPSQVDLDTRDSLAFSPPVYPSPWMNPKAPGWEEAYAKAKDFVSQLTLMEKVNLTTGVG